MTESDSGIDLSTGNVCPSCGARNNHDQSHCWQCRGLLAPVSVPRHVTPPFRRKVRPRPIVNTGQLEQRFVLLGLGCAVVALLLTVQLLQESARYDGLPAQTIEGVYAHYLVATRVITGAVLAVAWPAILHLAARALRIQFPRPSYFLTLLGVVLGTLTYSLTFLPWPLIGLAIVLPPVAALGLFFSVLRLHARPAILLWLLQGTLMLGIAAGTIWGLESTATGHALNPLRELPIIYRVARHAAPREQRIAPRRLEQAFPPFRWPSSGSVWLDRRANRVRIAVELSDRTRDWHLRLSLWESAETIAQARNDESPATLPVFTPQPDTNYRLVLDPVDVRGGDAVLHGLFPAIRHEGGQPSGP